MTRFDHNELIERLQFGIAERQSRVSAPAGIGEDARRAARKRTATRAVGAGVPVLAAAGLATVLATSPGSGPAGANGPGAGGAAQAPAASGGPVHGEDVALVVKRVKTQLSGDTSSSFVVSSLQYDSADVSSDGSLGNLGNELSHGWSYDAPNGNEYGRTVGVGKDAGIDNFGVTGAVINGHSKVTSTIINDINHTYSRQITDYSVPANAKSSTSGTVELGSSPVAVRQALQTGRVTEKGTATVNGTPAIALSVALPSAYSLSYTLFVDARTYKPLRTEVIGTAAGDANTFVSDWEPATSANIARAKDDSIPAGYTKVANAS
jgi:hypothetical protein